MSTESLIKLEKSVLKNNCFQFVDRVRKQKESTALRAKFAPPIPLFFKDDTFMICQLNKFHATLRFSCDNSPERVHYLDIESLLENKEILSELHLKEADSHHFIHP